MFACDPILLFESYANFALFGAFSGYLHFIFAFRCPKWDKMRIGFKKYTILGKLTKVNGNC